MPSAIQTLPGSLKPRLREVSTLPSWIYCFLAYVAILAPDQATRDRLAYARLIIHQAQQHGGSGWQAYDRVFRQQAALDSTLPWNQLHPGIQASTMFGGQGQSSFCTLCRGLDHSATNCALAYMEQPTRPRHPTTSTQVPCTRRPETASYSLCVSWNRGKYLFPNGCKFRHVCSTCYQHHRAMECPGAKETPTPRPATQVQTTTASRPRP